MQSIIKITPGAIVTLSIIILVLNSGMHDIDADGIPDSEDNCMHISNPSQENFDLDNF